VFRWSQVGGEDQLSPTEDVVVSPPIGPIDAHGERIVRVVRVGPASEAEASYRLIVDELPPPPDPNNRRVRLLMRHSIPLFFAAEGPSAAKVSWSTVVDHGALTLGARNDGSRHIRISGVKVVDSAGDVLTERSGLLGYILAGAEMRWTLPSRGAGPRRAAHLSAEGDTGAVDVALAGEP
jgi:fimbrial chaperone protein